MFEAIVVKAIQTIHLYKMIETHPSHQLRAYHGSLQLIEISSAPLPNMTINLSATADKVFRPDNIITGHVSFTPVVPIAPHAIEVSLNGQSLVWYRTSYKTNNDKTYHHHWRDNAPLLEVVKSVLPALDSKSPPLQVGQTYTNPIFFRFPAGTGNKQPNWTVQAG
jgi:hypothetical protein